MATVVKMIGDKILVRPQATETKSKGGVLLPDTAQVKSLRGKVLSVGRDVDEDIEEGDVVLYQNRTVDVKIDDEDLVILREHQINGVIKSK